ncbi:PadR family transcriptional regulator [Methanothermococcus okinawensis]|uniref:Transcriptional regulator, PadR-like family n=1 Tax=Methanothermococcus okinawensis (strain DSM 14208 / JCM 11175 / IH1) TaxID=647113 RepID=F8AMP4_METOI|nr:PadR family transcriptional regulator [Methanothermococcus okinawensis]AEH06875.1 transcriptional regulator, PadR-like family [Methanothermococcus okinawensis IH1]
MKHLEKFRGSLKLLILYLLDKEDLHGYALMQKLSELFINYKPSSGVIYPTLQGLKRSGYIEYVKFEADEKSRNENKNNENENENKKNNHSKKLYRITDKGREYLKENDKKLKRIFEHINNINEFYDLGGKSLKEAMTIVIKEIPNLSEKQKKELKTVMTESSKKIKMILLGD